MKTRFTEEQIIRVLKEAEAGAKTSDLCRRPATTAVAVGAKISSVADLERLLRSGSCRMDRDPTSTPN